MDRDALRLLVSMHRLTRQVRLDSMTQSLHPTQFVVLVLVSELQPVRIGTIATHVPCPQPTATMAVAALENAGLVRREPDEVDKRATNVALTDEGRKAITAMVHGATEALSARLDRLDDADRKLVLDAGAVLARLAEADPQ